MDANFCWMHSSLLASADMIELRTTKAYSNLDLIKKKYSTYRHSREENLWAMVVTIVRIEIIQHQEITLVIT
jgi:hypothetical protein